MREQNTMIFLPLLAQVLLTIVVFIGLAVVKARARKRNEIDLERSPLYNDAWPESVLKINNNIRNQFEVPVLFYVITIVLWLLNSAGALVQSLAWLFVASRALHAYVHTGSNEVRIRRPLFLFGCLIVIVMLAMAVRAVFAA